RVGPRLTERRPALELEVPVLNPRGFRPHEIMVIHRLPAAPNAVRPAEIGDAAAGRDAGASKHQHAAGGPPALRQGFAFSLHIPGNVASNPGATRKNPAHV